MRPAFLMSVAVTAGCMTVGCVGERESEPQPGPTPTTPIVNLALYINEDPEQGRHILGELPDKRAGALGHYRVKSTSLDGFDVSVLPAGPAGVNGSNLTATDGTVTFSHDDEDFMWMTFEGIPGGRLQIVGVQPAPAGSVRPSTRYFLQYSSDNGLTWSPYCTNGGGAVALQGGYDLDRIHTHSTQTITFSCEDGVATKCDGWGYVAGNAGPASIEWKHHQACTGMANASYCGNGMPFTREKTPIRIRDFRSGYANDLPTDLGHPAEPPGDPDTFYVEAGWDEFGLPVCLSKIRWAGLPPNPCPGVLPDPRFVYSTEAFFCDDLPATELWKKGAVLVNGSKMMDAPLQHWRNPKTGDDVSTIRGFFINRDGKVGADSDSTFPFTDYTVYLGTDGMLLRNLPGTLDETTQMYPLYMQTVGDDRFVSDTVPPVDPDLAFEGYSFQSATTVPTLTPLNLCTGSGGDRNTTVGSVTACSSVTDLMYALPAP